jgi:hypothetical protein
MAVGLSQKQKQGDLANPGAKTVERHLGMGLWREAC